MRFDFLNDTANDLLEIYEKAQLRKKQYIKTLRKKISKKEDEQLSERFFLEEYNKFLEQSNQKNNMPYPDITEDYKTGSLEFDELQDMLEDDN